jgi:hypothetical protein
VIKSIAMLLAGAAIGAALIVACSDDSPGNADAAVCDCPAAEAPLAGRFSRIRGVDTLLPPNSGTVGVAVCPAGSILISGWCGIENMPGSPPQAALIESGPFPGLPNNWTCNWNNYTLGSATVHAEAVCLMPAT